MIINDVDITTAYEVYAVNLGHYIFQWLDVTAPGDIPPDVAMLPVVGLRKMDDVLIIDTILEV